VEGLGDHDAGESLAVADDEVGDAGGELEDGGESAEDFVEAVELVVDGGLDGACLLEECGSGVFVSAAEAGADGESSGAVSAAGCGCCSEELIGDLGHGGDDDNGLFASRHASCHNAGGTFYSDLVLNRGAAKLHHYQTHYASLSFWGGKASPNSNFWAPDPNRGESERDGRAVTL
jgi:hypothetical protein